jgi:hypothetical protein
MIRPRVIVALVASLAAVVGIVLATDDGPIVGAALRHGHIRDDRRHHHQRHQHGGQHAGKDQPGRVHEPLRHDRTG